ncbi:NYN domain-containing protein [Salinithrix halophila]|uniref:NYN domain-containing protein n=1 Tax=Salinithrix halophila TaxID=1485204 RepID=A0ABV8JER8_9BACL
MPYPDRSIAIFIDYENVYYGLKKYHVDPDHPESRHNLFLRLLEHYGRTAVRMVEAYADFEVLNKEISMHSLQKKRVHIHQVYGNGRGGDERKNAADIQLCLDAMDLLHQVPELSTFVIVSADQDMVPLMDRLWTRGKRVELFCLQDESWSKTARMEDFCDEVHNLFDFLHIRQFQNLSQMDRMLHDALVQIYEWYDDPNNSGKSYGSSWIRKDMVKKFNLHEEEAASLFNKLVQGKYLEPYEITVDSNIYYGYRVNMEHPQVRKVLRIAGYRVVEGGRYTAVRAE